MNKLPQTKAAQIKFGAMCWINGMTLFEMLEEWDKPGKGLKNRPRVKVYA